MKAYIITGTSSGLGKAFFELLKEKEGRLVAIARRFLPEQEAVAKESQGRIVLVHKELTDFASLPTAQDFAKWVQGEGIEEVVFINNAAVVEPIGKIGELDAEKIIVANHVNLTAAMLMTNALFAVPQMANGPLNVKVLNISSGAAKRTIGGWAVYCAAKAGNEMFFDVLADQFEGDRVTVHNINPGVMDTSMQEKIRAAEFPTRERYVNLKAANQLPTPEQVAAKITEEHGL